MKVKKIYYGLILNLLILIPLITSIRAEVPSYVGVEEGDEYIWEFEFDEVIFNKTIDDGLDLPMFNFFKTFAGLKLRIVNISSEVYELGRYFVPIEVVLYQTYFSVSENNWDLHSAGELLLHNPYDMTHGNVWAGLWMSILIPRFVNWTIIAASIYDDLYEYYSVGSVRIESWTHGISAVIYYTSNSSAVRFTNEYTVDGILKDAIAWYDFDKIATVKLYDPQNTQIQSPSISGFSVISVSIIGIISVGIAIVKIKKRNNY